MMERIAHPNHFRSLHWIIALAALLLWTTGAQAQTNICYTGNLFTTFNSLYDGAYGYVSGCVTLDITLGPNDSTYANLAGDVVSVTSFTDNIVNAFSVPSDTVTNAYFSTSGGTVVAWNFTIVDSGGDSISTENDDVGSLVQTDQGTNVTNCCFGPSQGIIYGSPGQWTPVSVTPEPSTAVLWLTGAGLIIVTRKRLAELLGLDTGTHG